jgi:site-specific recombinase XerD
MNSVALTTQETGITKEVISTLLSQVGETSVGTYMEAIRQFMTFSIERIEQHPFQNPYSAVVAYRRFLVDEEYSASTTNKKLSIVKQFMKIAAIHQLITLEQAYAVEGIKNVKTSGDPLRKWLSQDQARELIYTPDTSTMQGKRDQLILMFGLVLGLRREEMINITWGQFMQVANIWVIRDVIGKGNSINLLEIPEKYAKMIRDYGREADDKPILTSVDKYDHKRGKLTKESVNYVLKKFNVQPHTLRRTSATMIIENGGDIRDAQKHLRHQDQKTTEHYLNKFVELGKSAVNRIDL